MATAAAAGQAAVSAALESATAAAPDRDNEGASAPADLRGLAGIGELFFGLLKFFGKEFNYTRQAVAVGAGGVIPKARQYDLGKEALCVLDPLAPGSNISTGTRNLVSVRPAFHLVLYVQYSQQLCIAKSLTACASSVYAQLT